MKENDAACVIPEQELNPEVLAGLICNLLRDESKLSVLAENSSRLGKQDATSRIVALIEKVIKNNNKKGKNFNI